MTTWIDRVAGEYKDAMNALDSDDNGRGLLPGPVDLGEVTR